MWNKILERYEFLGILEVVVKKRDFTELLLNHVTAERVALAQ